MLDFDIVTWPVVLAVIAVTVVAAVGTVWLIRRRRRGLAVVSGLLTVALVALSIGALVNLHFGYYRNLDELFGGTPGESSLSSVNKLLDKGTVPANGVVVTEPIPAPKSGVHQSRPAVVYLPPAWFKKPQPSLPVLFLLHGTPGQPSDWVDGGEADDTMNAFAAEHDGVAPIVVMPDINAGAVAGDTECVNTPTTNEEDYLTEDVPDWVKANLHPDTNPAQWAIGGLSEGGMCSFMLSLRHPNTWRSFLNFSGESAPSATGEPTIKLFGGSKANLLAHSPLVILQKPNPLYPSMGAYFGCGSGDDPALVADAKAGAAATKAAGIPTELQFLPGGHQFFYWSAALKTAMPWLAQRLGIT